MNSNLKLTMEQSFLLASIRGSLENADRETLVSLALDAVKLSFLQQNYVKDVMLKEIQDIGFGAFHDKVFEGRNND